MKQNDNDVRADDTHLQNGIKTIVSGWPSTGMNHIRIVVTERKKTLDSYQRYIESELCGIPYACNMQNLVGYLISSSLVNPNNRTRRIEKERLPITLVPRRIGSLPF
jgi:hypothetical protein